MSLHIIKNVKLEESQNLVNMIYYNFENLAEYEELMHNKAEIRRLVTDPHSKIIFILVNNRIAAYLVGEIKDLNDGRRVFYISYIYTAEKFRKQGFASQLLKYVETITKKFKYDGIMLTNDVEDEDVHNFYLMRGFMPDLILRRYNKFDVLFKPIN